METPPVKLELVTPPATEPVSLAEAKLHCRVDISDDDAWFTAAIAAARSFCETQSGRCFVTQTWRQYFPSFPVVTEDDWWRGCHRTDFPAQGEAAIELAKNPLASVTSITYVSAADGSTLTLASTEYTADTKANPGVIVPAYGKSWPEARQQRNAVTVEFVTGVAVGSVDPRAKIGILMLVAHWYENRETVLVGTVSKELEMSLKNLMGQLWNGTLR